MNGVKDRLRARPVRIDTPEITGWPRSRHQHRVIRRTLAATAIGAAERGFQFGAEPLEIRQRALAF